MKKLLIALLMLVFTTGAAVGQQRIIEKTFAWNRGEVIDLDLKFGTTVSIKAWNKDEVSFRAVAEINSGRLNDALLVEFDESRGIAVNVDYDKELIKQGRVEDCHDHFSTYSWRNGDSYAVCSNIIYEIFVPGAAEIRVESISADFELEGLHGPVRAKTISGFVDLSWPTGRGAELSLKTISGEAYTNLDGVVFANRKKSIPLVGYEIRGTYGTGGPQVRLESISGDIYLRKM